MGYFSEEELFLAFRAVATDADARAIARAGRDLLAGEAGSQDRTGNSGLHNRVGPLPFEAGLSVDITEDALALLSLVSPATKRKVDAFRLAALGGRTATKEEEAQWEKRLAAVRALRNRRAGRP